MAARSQQKSSETIQIVILTLFMTAGFFAVFTLVLMALIPGKETEVSRQIDELKRLQDAFRKGGELYGLRNDVEELRRQGAGTEEENLRAIVTSQLKLLGIDTKDIPAEKTRQLARSSRGRKGTVEHSQTIGFKKVSTQKIFDLIARVKMRKNGIRVASLSLTRDRGADPVNPTWGGKIEFKVFENPDLQRELRAQAKRAAARRAKKKSAAPAGETSGGGDAPSAGGASKGKTSAPAQGGPKAPPARRPVRG